MKIDLHIHTNYSDGSLSPKEVVDLAAKRGVHTIAITDHDTVAGVKEAILAAKGKGIKVIPGIEISSSVNCSKDDIHLLGFDIDYNSKGVRKLCKEVIKSRRLMTEKKLRQANRYFHTDITYEDIAKKTKGMPGTPHIGRALFERGFVRSIKEGVGCIIKGGRCYISSGHKRIDAKKVIKIIHDAGGIAVLAHLAVYKNNKKFVSHKKQEELVKELAKYGLDGLELYIPSISRNDIKFEKKLIDKYNLLVSGGSDFHDEGFIRENKLGFLNIKKDKITVLRD